MYYKTISMTKFGDFVKFNRVQCECKISNISKKYNFV